MTEMPLRPPAGRYGREPDARSRARTVVGLGALALVGLVVVVWVGIGMARTPVSWDEVGFRVIGDDALDVVYDVSRLDPSAPVRCAVEALNHRYGQVGVLEVDVPPSTARTVRVTTTVRTSERAVTGVVDLCWVTEP